MDAAKLTKGLVIGLRLDVDPLPPFGAGFGGQRLQLFIHQAGEQFWIGNGGTLFAFGEEIAGDEASGCFVGGEADEADAFIGGGDFFFEKDAADDAGILTVPFGQLVPDAFLRGMIGGEGEGLENFERHLVGFVSCPESGAETGKSQAAMAAVLMVVKVSTKTAE